MIPGMVEQYRGRPNTGEGTRETSVSGEFGVEGAQFSDEQLLALVSKRANEINRRRESGQLSEAEAEEERLITDRLAVFTGNGSYEEAANIFADFGVERIKESINKFAEFQFQQLEDGDDLSPEERNNIKAEGARLARSAANSYANGLLYLQAAHHQLRRAIDVEGMDDDKAGLIANIEETLDDGRVRTMLNHGFVARAIPQIPGYKNPPRQSRNLREQRIRREQQLNAAVRTAVTSPPAGEQARNVESIEKPRLRTRLAKYLKAFTLNPLLPGGKSKAGYLLGVGLGVGLDALSSVEGSTPWRAATTAALMSWNGLRDALLWRKFFKSTTAEERTRIEETMQKGSRFRRGLVAGLAASSFMNMVAPNAAESVLHSDLVREYGEFAGTVGKEMIHLGVAGAMDVFQDQLVADENFGTGPAFGGQPSESPSFQGFGDTDFLHGDTPPAIQELTNTHEGPNINGTPDFHSLLEDPDAYVQQASTRGQIFNQTATHSIANIQEAAGELGQAHVDAFESAGDALDNWYNEVFGEGRVVEGHRRRPGSERERPESGGGIHVYDEVTVEAGDTLDKILAEEGVHPSLVYGSVESMHDFIAQNEQVLMVGNEDGVREFYQFLYQNPDATPDEVRKYFYDAVRMIGTGQELNIPTSVITDAPPLPDLSGHTSSSPTFEQIGAAIDDLDIEVNPLPIYSDLGDRLMSTTSGKIVAGGTLFGALMYRIGQKRKK